jgi:hypothetical protein
MTLRSRNGCGFRRIEPDSTHEPLGPRLRGEASHRPATSGRSFAHRAVASPLLTASFLSHMGLGRTPRKGEIFLPQY